MAKFVEIYSTNAKVEEERIVITPPSTNKEYVCYFTVQEGKNWEEATEQCSIVGYYMHINEKGELTLTKDRK